MLGDGGRTFAVQSPGERMYDAIREAVDACRVRVGRDPQQLRMNPGMLRQVADDAGELWAGFRTPSRSFDHPPSWMLFGVPVVSDSGVPEDEVRLVQGVDWGVAEAVTFTVNMDVEMEMQPEGRDCFMEPGDGAAAEQWREVFGDR